MTFPKIELHVHLEATVRADDPAMFGSDLAADYAAAQLGVGPQQCHEAGARGALCDESTRSSPRRIGAEFDWTPTVLTNEAV